jgi:hypothetical protein
MVVQQIGSVQQVEWNKSMPDRNARRISSKTGSWNRAGFNFGLICQAIFVEVMDGIMPK